MYSFDMKRQTADCRMQIREDISGLFFLVVLPVWHSTVADSQLLPTPLLSLVLKCGNQGGPSLQWTLQQWNISLSPNTTDSESIKPTFRNISTTGADQTTDTDRPNSFSVETTDFLHRSRFIIRFIIIALDISYWMFDIITTRLESLTAWRSPAQSKDLYCISRNFHVNS